MSDGSALECVTVDFGVCPGCGEPRSIVEVGNPYDHLNQGITLVLNCSRCLDQEGERRLEIISTRWARWRRESNV